MSIELRPVQVRLPDEAFTELQIIAAAQDKDLGEVAREGAVAGTRGGK